MEVLCGSGLNVNEPELYKPAVELQFMNLKHNMRKWTNFDSVQSEQPYKYNTYKSFIP